jgi:hypothetical protein
MWVEDEEGGEHSNFKSLSDFVWKGKKKIIRVEFPKASFIILFPLLWAAGQYKI